MNKLISTKRVFKVIWKFLEKNDLWLKVDIREIEMGLFAVKLLNIFADKEFIKQLEVSYNQGEIDEKQFNKPRNKPKRVTEKNVPDIPVTPRGKGVPVKEKLTLKFVNDRVSALDKKVDTLNDRVSALEKKVDSGFKKLNDAVAQLTMIVQEQGKVLKAISDKVFGN